MDIRYRLREIREAAGFSESELAKLIGITRPAVYRIEQGDNHPRVSTLILWAQACGYELRLVSREDPVASRFSELTVDEQQLVTDFEAIVPGLSRDQRKMYALIFDGIAQLLDDELG